MPLISVIDCETTGLNAARHDRVIEIAAVVIDPRGDVVREFVSLINPGRDVGKTSLHGITASDVAEAPRFEQIAGHLAQTLDGTIALAGHNVSFDHRFLRSEFDRAGVAIPDISTLCTMRIAGGGNLECCCRDLGIDFDPDGAHSALEDARAAARLLASLLREGLISADEVLAMAPVAWPQVSHAVATPLPRALARQRASETPGYLRRLLSHAGPFCVMAVGEEAALDYAGLLERVLEDRHIDQREGEALVTLAGSLGLDGDAIRLLHEAYLERLVVAALADSVITHLEQRDLESVGRLLGVDDEQLADMIARCRRTHAQSPARVSTADAAAAEILAGKRVCFTGESICSQGGVTITRERAAALAEAAGMEISDSVTKKLDILVVADPHTQSGKARKARQYGKRIIHEPVLWQMLGVAID
jgi:DNA polymerase-3 subunit epsilon